MEKKKILFVSQEMYPFVQKTELSAMARRLPQAVQDNGREIRVFTPKFGTINERRHQLHEVIRLSGMNIVIDDKDHPLLIKVASIPSARMQVYFIDNDEFFKRKHAVTDENGIEFIDNDERAMFFCRGTLETVKKLGWKPDVIYCQGWMSALMPLYIKKVYNKDPHFKDAKVVLALTNEVFSSHWDARLGDKFKFEGFGKEAIGLLKDPSYSSVMELCVNYADGLCLVEENAHEINQQIFDAAQCCKLDYVSEEHQAKTLSSFFDKVADGEVVVS
jgi:starch synthase